VDRLVLLAPAGVPTVRRLGGYAVPLLRTARNIGPRLLPVLAADALRAGPRTILGAARELLVGDVERWLPAVRAPTLLIWGEKDTLVPVAAAEAFRTGMAGAELMVIPDAGHVPMYDNPEAVARAILSFLAGTGNRRPEDRSARE
jgi:pimeloyl-ACP methyl ester carboxylesterase